MASHWALPETDPWSTQFAKILLDHLDIFPGATVLDVAAGSGIPAFYIAEQVGPTGRTLAIDLNQGSILRAKSTQKHHLPWLEFRVGNMKDLPPEISRFDRITGNLSFMFFRPDRFTALKQLVSFLNPGGQIVLTFPSLGTFDSLWERVKREMAERSLTKEAQALDEYIHERPSADHARQWLNELGMQKVEVTEWPLEIATGSGTDFLYHPLLRGGFLEDIYECFEDQVLAEEFMTVISQDIASFTPLLAQRCAMSGWLPGNKD